MSTPGYGPPDPEGEKYGTPPQAPQPGTPAGYPAANPGGYPPPGPGGYPPPNPGGYPPPGPGGYPPAGYPGQQGGYPPAGYPGQQGGYPGQQGGYPPGNQFMPGGLVRPGPIMASAVIGYVLSGFLFIAGLILLASASTVEDLVGGLVDTSGLALLGLGDVIAGGLLIAGGVAVSGGKINGRIMTSAAAGICVLCGLRWLSIDGSTIAWVIGFCAPALLATFFLWQKPSSQWLASRSVR